MNAHAMSQKARQAASPSSGTGSHVAMGIALAAGAVLAAGLIAHHNDRADVVDQYDPDYAELVEPTFRPKKAIFGMIWPPLMMALTLSGLRVWNAPPSADRTRALTLWSLVQGFNTVWMAAGPKRLGGQVTASVASLATSAAYALSARRVNAPAGNLAGPYIGWMGLANVLTEQLWRRPRV
jgi:benzodiazapine receptor